MSADRYQQDDRAPLGSSSGQRLEAEHHGADGVDSYPELEPVVSLAVDTVAQAFDITDDRDPALLSQLEATVTEGTVEAYAPMASTADVLARSDRQARDVRSAAAARSADLMAVEVADTAAALRTKNETTVAQLAAERGQQNRDTSPGHPRASTPVTAAQGAALVHRAAQAKAAERERLAAEVAGAAARAASTLATSVEAEASEVRNTVSDAASTLRSESLSSSYQVALSVGVEAAEQLQEYKVD